MITKQNFIPQRLSFADEQLKLATCGVCSAAMVISQITGVYVSGEEVLTRLSMIQSSDKDVVIRDFMLTNGETVTLTINILGKQVSSSVQDRVEQQTSFRPAFMLERGYDHRASSQLFLEYGIRAQLMEKIDIYDLTRLFRTGEVRFFLASRESQISDTNHIVIITGFDFKSSVVNVIDPWELSFEDASKSIPILEFSEKFNGYGTAVYA